MITIIDYGLGNLTSVKNALDKLGIENQISNENSALQNSDGLILPGVGAAGVAMKNLKERNLDTTIVAEIKKGKPFLGLCLGMQLLMSFSDEGDVECLNIIPGTVKEFKINLKVPQIGWNNVEIIRNKSRIMNLIKDRDYFYFVHSFYCDPTEASVMTGTTEYGINFCSVLEKDNVFGAQFHPEKSADAGLQLLKNFSALW